MKKYILMLLGVTAVATTYATGLGRINELKGNDDLTSARNLKRAVELTENAIKNHMLGEEMLMARYYDPCSDSRSEEVGSVWMYTSAIEAVNAILQALKDDKSHRDGQIFDEHFGKFEDILSKLYQNAEYYLGTFTLTSYTQTKEWTIYGVNRGQSKGKAAVEGIENVYDDQMWLIRELLDSYRLTNKKDYLDKAEYLTEYVLDGWDCTIDENGNERGGIPWGPGYVTKHACSNGPLISPLVWLHEIYNGKDDEIAYNYIDNNDRKSRKQTKMKKSEYYLMFAGKIYDWQMRHLLRTDGVYDDMMGGCTPRHPEIEVIDGAEYRKGITCVDAVGPAISYNSGTMLSAAADLYKATGNTKYAFEGARLADAAFRHFATKDAEVQGYYTYSVSGFNNWFNGILLRALVDFQPLYPKTSEYIETFQQNMDYGYDNFLHKNVLPTNLLAGWGDDDGNCKTEGMFSFAFGAQYAVLSSYLSNTR